MELTTEQKFLLVSIGSELKEADRDELIALTLDAIRLTLTRENYIKALFSAKLQDGGFDDLKEFHTKVFKL